MKKLLFITSALIIAASLSSCQKVSISKGTLSINGHSDIAIADALMESSPDTYWFTFSDHKITDIRNDFHPDGLTVTIVVKDETAKPGNGLIDLSEFDLPTGSATSAPSLRIWKDGLILPHDNLTDGSYSFEIKDGQYHIYLDAVTEIEGIRNIRIDFVGRFRTGNPPSIAREMYVGPVTKQIPTYVFPYSLEYSIKDGKASIAASSLVNGIQGSKVMKDGTAILITMAEKFLKNTNTEGWLKVTESDLTDGDMTIEVVKNGVYKSYKPSDMANFRISTRGSRLECSLQAETKDGQELRMDIRSYAAGKALFTKGTEIYTFAQ